jgi:hypothetical protein
MLKRAAHNKTNQGVLRPGGYTKRCRLSLLTNSALLYESYTGGMGWGGVAGSKPMCTAVHIT